MSSPSGSKRRMAILTSGGDAPGMNSAIRAATLLGIAEGWEVIGVSQGYRGLLDGSFAPLTARDVAPIVRRGGTILGSARCLDFHKPEARAVARRRLREAGIEALLVIGGNGSLTGALALSDPAESGDEPVRVLGLPASIDNDIGVTGISIGVDTAMNTIVEACDKISDTADAHDRTFIVEVMGRACGYLAMTSGIAAGADVVLFPEAGHSEERVVEKLVKTVRKVRERKGRTRRVLVIKAEGVSIPVQALKAALDERMRNEPGGDPDGAECRVTVLGHVVRGGRPSAFDRLLGSRLAHVAVRAMLEGANRKMAAWAPAVAPSPEIAERSSADPHVFLADLAATLDETARMNDHSTPLVQWRVGVFERLDDVLSI